MSVDGVILAAGYSSRANTFKMELKIQEKSILQRCIESLYDECNKIIVVSGYKHERIENLVENYSKVQIVHNKEFHKGMFSSIKKGIQSVTAERFLLTPGDYPLINKDIVKELLNEKNEIVIPSFNKRGGHPILLSSNLIKEILKEQEDSNLKIYLSKKQCLYLNIHDKGILLDVDTIEDYNYIKNIISLRERGIENFVLEDKDMQDYKNNIKILKGNIIYTETSDFFKIVEHGYIVVKENFIEGVYAKLPEKFKNIKIEDYKDKLIIPGFIDLHTHAPQYAIKGIGYDKELLPWLETYTFPEESKFENISYATKIYKEFVNELYNEGTTRAVIFATIHPEATEILMDLIEEKGIISYVGKVNMDRNCPDILKENSTESIKATIQWINNCNKKYKFVKPIITPRFVPSCTSYLMKELGDIAINNTIPVQSHLSENLSEIDWVKKLHPECKNYGDVYNKFNLFGQTKTIMAHCVHLTEEEINIIEKNKVLIAHCPTSNVNLSSGISPINKLLRRKIQIGLGSDIAGGESLSMFSVMASAIKMSKLRKVCFEENENSLTIQEVFYLATKGGGKFFGNVGSFEEGYEFDALIIDDDNLWKANKGNIEERIERLIYLGDSKNIVTRYVFGKEI